MRERRCDVGRCIQDFGVETCGKGNHLEGPGVDARIILWICKKLGVGGHGLD